MRISLQAGVQPIPLHDADAAGDAVAITPGKSAGGDCSTLLGKGKDSGDPGRHCDGEVRGPMIAVAEGSCYHAVRANVAFRDVHNGRATVRDRWGPDVYVAEVAV